MRNIVIVIALLLCWYACSDDNTEIPQVSGITRTTFVDERDMTEYECIVVNGQTWLAENLRYRLPLGALEGCYTFDETTVSASAEEFVPIVRAALEAGEIVDPMPTPLFNSMSFLLDNLDGVYYTVDNFMSNYVDYPDVLAQLEKCEEEAMVGSVAAALVDFDAQNGGYSEKYGFLYTYEAAQAALPEASLTGDPSTWFTNIRQEENGTVTTLAVGGVEVKGNQLRTILGLRSACFTISFDGDTVTFSVTGYGHGVGMSQYGANVLAADGMGYRDILAWYYTGTTVEVYP